MVPRLRAAVLTLSRTGLVGATAVAGVMMTACSSAPRETADGEPQTAENPAEQVETTGQVETAEQTQTADCTPAAGPLDASASAQGFGGSYRLVLVAMYGDMEGSTASGTLALYSTPAELVELADPFTKQPMLGVSIPFLGTAELDVQAVGGEVAGTISSEDPNLPGVLLLELRSETEGVAPQILLRFGSVANDRSIQRFDGAFFVLTTTSISDSGFRGSWASGVTGQRATGYFCATRIAG